MAEAFLAVDILQQEARQRRLYQREYQLEQRESQDPFDFTENEFKERYRLNKRIVSNLVDQLEPLLQPARITGLTVEKQVLSAVRFYATGCFQRPIGDQWGISMSQSSISRCLHNVTDAINNTLLRHWIQFPLTPQDREIAREQFRNARHPFSGAIGAIDCTHIALCAPKDHEEAYVNHHGYHSLNVQMICDPNLKILNVNARFPGARHDAYIWASSPVRRVMERAYNNGERRTFLIGDSGYPLEPWLLTPLPHELEGTPRFRYNEAICRARNCVERLFGVLKGTWRCLSNHRVLQYEPGFAGRIVNACAVLHNIRIAHGLNEEFIDYEFVDGILENNGNEHIGDQQVRPLAVAQRIQNSLIAERFSD